MQSCVRRSIRVAPVLEGVVLVCPIHDSETSVYTADPGTPGKAVVVNVECKNET